MLARGSSVQCLRPFTNVTTFCHALLRLRVTRRGARTFDEFYHTYSRLHFIVSQNVLLGVYSPLEKTDAYVCAERGLSNAQLEENMAVH